MYKNLFTSESVTEGHPDKVCDKISDAVLDAALKEDKDSRVACETCATTGLVMVMGEITTKANLNVPKIARETLKEIGYEFESGFNADEIAVLVNLDEQSPDIAMGTNDEVGGAGDQGLMFGYACDETKDLMPLPITLANRLAYRLAQARKCGVIPFILPDGKTQVTIEYDEFGKPLKVDTIVVSTQHYFDVTQELIEEYVVRHVINPVLDDLANENERIITSDYKLFINPTGRFVKGGPAADSGLTGRKIIVDTYGGYAPHGGGAFSGKDPTKVDRSAAYAARHIAKNIVAAGLATKCQLQIAYAIGVKEPVSIKVDTFGTGKIKDSELGSLILKSFDLTPQGIINRLNLRRPIYKRTAAYGHFGSVIGEKRPWEEIDYVDKI